MRVRRCNPDLFKLDLSGRTYIVTGANSGTGLATTEQLVRQGAHVVAACKRLALCTLTSMRKTMGVLRRNQDLYAAFHGDDLPRGQMMRI